MCVFPATGAVRRYADANLFQLGSLIRHASVKGRGTAEQAVLETIVHLYLPL